MPERAFVIGVPLLSNIQVNASSAVRLSDVMVKDDVENEWVVDYNALENELGDNGVFYLDYNIDLLYAGFRYEQNYFSFGWSLRSFTDAWISDDLIALRRGNWYEGSNTLLQHDIDNVAFNTTTFSQFRFGWAGKPNDQLTIGAALKVLTGGVNVQTVTSHWYLSTSENLYYNKLSGETNIKSSLPIEVTVDDEGYVDDISFDDDASPLSYLFNKNFGLAFDFGVDYKYNDQLEFSFDIKDVGYMRWKEGVNNFKTDYDFLYSGIYVTPATIADEDFDFFENLGDSISDANFTVDSAAYTTYLPQTVSASMIYHLDDMFTFGGMVKSRFYNKKIYPELTLASLVKPVDWFQGSVSLGFDRNSIAKVGMGFQFDAGPVQAFVQASNLQGFMLDKAKSIGVSFGINFLFAEKRFY